MDYVSAFAKMLEDYGRNGDSHLVHVNDREMEKLKADGGSGSRNPQTGLMEFFDDASGGGGSGSGSVNEAGALGADTGSSLGNIGAISPEADRPIGLSGTSPNSQAMQSNNPNIGPDPMQALLGQDISGSHLSGRNAALDGIQGQNPSFGSRVEDYLGIDNPGGFLGSNGARGLAGLLGGIAGGPGGGIAASALAGLLQGRDPLNTAFSALSSGAGAGIGALTGIPSGLASMGINGAISNFGKGSSSPAGPSSTAGSGVGGQESMVEMGLDTIAPSTSVPSSTIASTAATATPAAVAAPVAAVSSTPAAAPAPSPYSGGQGDISNYLQSIGAYLRSNPLAIG